MTLAEFIAAHDHKYLDFDGVYGAQCVDLADYYLRDVWAVPVFFVTGAVDLFGHEPDKIEWITNEAGNASQFPEPGDMVIWQQDTQVGTGVFGHVDIFVSGNGLAFTGFDQNWPVGSPAHLQAHNYEGVKGWGRLRPPPAPQPPPAPVPPPAAPPEPVDFYSFHVMPPDDLHPADGVMTLTTARQLAAEYIADKGADVTIAVANGFGQMVLSLAGHGE